ncbi:ABC transporter substrate-binding protein [Porphyromonas sp.]|uniref:ABC transporter substrate-binding protein n=1 Tax=Porphyromonas sp. TaxID=1924944 RepID=UPI0026DD6FFE|nr:ABC transporter substrate-binding protein [Porphyromonas sp.]MDO4771484.1 ABC transporter substrate-binding protein [Porphyromonas sp.]
MKYITLILSLFIFVGCAGKQGQKGTSDLPKLKLGAMSSVDYIPFAVAERMGINDSLGLDVEIVKFFSANDRDAAFRTGIIDGTVIDFTGAALQHANGVPLSLVMKHDGLFELIVKEGQDLSSLKGKKIAVSRNTVIEYATDRILSEAGVSRADITKVEINKIPLRMEMLLSGGIDASVFPDPFALIAKERGAVSLVSTGSLGFHVTGTMFTAEAIKTKGESIRTLLKAYNLAVDYMRYHPRTEWIHILTEDAGFPQEVAELVQLPDFTYAQLPDAADMQATIAWLKEKALVPADYDSEGLVDKSFIP